MIAVQQPTDVPANAPDHCPGTESDLAGKVDACEGCPNQDICASGQTKSTAQDPTTIPMINERLAGVKRKILVLSGKGGVGKSTFTSQLGWALAADEDVQVIFHFPPLTHIHPTWYKKRPLTVELSLFFSSRVGQTLPDPFIPGYHACRRMRPPTTNVLTFLGALL